MSPQLTKKQNTQLTAMSHDDLIEMILTLIQDNKQAKSTLINQFLSTPDEMLKTIEKTYKIKTKSTRFYDYRETDTFFDELRHDVIRLFEKVVLASPEKSESLLYWMLVDFYRICETKDTSSGYWLDYYHELIENWFKSLSEQKQLSPQAVAQKIIAYLSTEHFLDISIFKQYRKTLGLPTLRALRDTFASQHELQDAINLSLFIKDIDFLEHARAQGGKLTILQLLDYAELMIDELHFDKALAILAEITPDSLQPSTDYKRWCLLKINAFNENGQKEEAKQLCLSAFGRIPLSEFYQAYSSLEKIFDEIDRHFITTAAGKGPTYLIPFLKEIARFELIAEYIQQYDSELLSQMRTSLQPAFLRRLSSDLYTQGYISAAIILRRCLAEGAILTAQSRYYAYAVSDLKKSFDYSIAMNTEESILEALSYFSMLYAKHHRKVALWSLIQEKITQLGITNNQFVYHKNI
ncbi:hypothetical protein [Providencia sp. Me31A]|uniref:hypothetical protein n=1 Tax=Providencia sp. Me31A TaxID=3392637 RepID=UPI003D2CF841